MSHLAELSKDVVPVLFKALPVEAKTNQQVLEQAFSLVEDPELRVNMALDLVKTKLPLAYLIPIMEPALQSELLGYPLLRSGCRQTPARPALTRWDELPNLNLSFVAGLLESQSIENCCWISPLRSRWPLRSK